jgi:ATP-dependent Clp protease ATP-binding subunit ClpA
MADRTCAFARPAPRIPTPASRQRARELLLEAPWPDNAGDVFETFSEEARAGITCAQQEAHDMGHREVFDEHLLLGLCADQSGIAGRLLVEFGLIDQTVRELVRQRLAAGEGFSREGDLPLAPGAKDALRLAYRIGMGEPGTQHVLIVLAGRGAGSREILEALGVDRMRLNAAAKKRAWPLSAAEEAARSQGQGIVKGFSRGLLEDLDFGD